MSNVEHPKHHQLSIDIDILEIINIVMYNTNINCYNGYLLGTTIEYLFKADKNNGLENCKIALKFNDAEIVLKKYIEEQEKQND